MEEVESPVPPLDESSPAASKNQSDTEKHPPSNGDRKKWDAAELPAFPVTQQTCGDTSAALAFSLCPENRPASGGDRKKWEAGVPLVPSVAQQTLEQTCITTIGEFLLLDRGHTQIPQKSNLGHVRLFPLCPCIISEQTAGEVIQMGGLHEDAPRKVWGGSPDSQVLRVLQEAELQPLTQQLENVSICEEDFSSPGSSSFSLFLLAKFEFKCLTTCNIYI